MRDSSANVVLEGLRTSTQHLQAIVAPLDDEGLRAPAYPSDWTIAQVLSHLGSGATILQRRLDDSLADRSTPDDFPQTVWDAWNSKDPRAQADDALVADAALVARIDGLSPAECEGFRFAMGPMQFDLPGFIGLRLNEHALHTWDIDVALDPTATIPTGIAALVVDNLQLITQYTAKYDGPAMTVAVHTTDPTREYTLSLSTDSVTLERQPASADASVELPAESLIRLVYGRLDQGHSSAALAADPIIERLRQTFPGP
jgi:uncharacterized protein (TIGR03083 family)